MIILNAKTEGTTLFEIDFTPKGALEMVTVCVYANNRLDASNFLVLNRIWGKQHAIRASLTSQIGETLTN